MPIRRAWRFLFGYERRQQLRQLRRSAIGETDTQWARVVMIEAMQRLVGKLPRSQMRALEISGDNWQNAGFGSYRQASYPDFDICAGTLPDRFDIIIADQVFEHLLWPYRAGRNAHTMLAPGGYFLLSTPFMIRIHNHPTDCTRWTEIGMKYFLAECGFAVENVETGSWGNRRCVVGNLKTFVPYRRRLHSLRNEPNYPMVIWALAQKSLAADKRES